ncbi:hypothetical protein [Microvirga terricola]|uniref:GIY-YIG domain-containing protein n=1 Tax=Microvirga terricola TaxID=2719797 RepID=A0ABX0VDR3_9HYPH|nr:hypothetical protein [Microvirga terricola]NIX77803.1 hypothetical protein [Microvirga terricola]
MGPFATIEEAQKIALEKGQTDNRSCLECLPKTGSDPTLAARANVSQHGQDAEQLIEQQLNGKLDLKWQPLGAIEVDEGAKLKFPPILNVPGLYRFKALHPSGAVSVYIGETENLRRRFGNYRNPGPSQQTSRRINVWATELLKDGGRIFVSISIEGRASIEERELQVDLRYKAWRRLFENWSLLLEGTQDVESLNL